MAATYSVIYPRFGLDEFDKAYEVFGDAASSGALKVVLTR